MLKRAILKRVCIYSIIGMCLLLLVTVEFGYKENVVEIDPIPVNLIQHSNSTSDDDVVIQNQMKTLILHAWNSYKLYAWGSDELKPITMKGSNWTSYSYMFTPVDSLDTLYIAGLMDEYQEAKSLVLNNMNFDIDPSSEEKNNHFEITIRVLGGLLSAYELDPDFRYIDKAVDLANRLLKAFQSNGLPSMWFNLRTGQSTSSSGLLASIGTIQLEMQYLSDITGNPVYQEKALGVLDILKNMQTEIPGLYPSYINTFANKFTAPYRYSIGPDSDSFYEYLLKIWISTKEEKYRDMYDLSMNAIKDNLLVRDKHNAYISDGIGDGNKVFHHLSCFAGGMFSLGGITRMTNNWSEQLDIGRRITDTCYKSYASTKTGLGGEIMNVQSDGSITLIEDKVSLRPEVIESIFYQYRITKDPKYREWGKKIIQSLIDNAMG
ncbi:glycoside hydrolase, partial [Globomyces pollinis-pini]